MTPQPFSTNILNVSQAFHNITFPLFRSGAPNVPVVAPGPGNPIQPTSIAPFYTAKQAEGEKRPVSRKTMTAVTPATKPRCGKQRLPATASALNASMPYQFKNKP